MTLDDARPKSAPCDVVTSRGDGRVYKRKGSSRYWIQYSVRGRQYREPGGKTPAAARKKLRQRLREAGTERFGGPAAERVTVDQLADALLVHMKNQGRASADKIRCHLKPVRDFFDGRPAMDVTTASLERYQRERLDAKKAPATVNREVHALRRAFNVAAHQTPPLFPKHLVPYFPSLPVDNVRSGFFERGEVEALLQHVGDEGVRDFIAWGFRTGMRKGEIARLTWDMLDRSGMPWVLRIPAAITKNRTGRTLGLEGEVRAIIERRLRVRRFDCPLIFHRECKGRPGQPITDFWDVWRNALQAAGLPAGTALPRPQALSSPDADPRRRGRDHGDEGLGPQDALDAPPLQHRHRARDGRRAAPRRRLSLDAADAGRKRKGTVEGHSRRRRREVVDGPERGWLLR